MKKQWFKNPNWNEEIAFEFEKRLKKVKHSSMQSQYLRAQAVHWLESKDAETNKKGVELIYRIFTEYQVETFDVMFGHGILGDYYFENAQFANAEKHYQIVYEYNLNNPNNKYDSPELRLADILFLSEKTHKAYQLLIDFNSSRLFLNSEKLYYYKLLALICNKLNFKEDAIQAAKTVLNILRVMQSRNEEYPKNDVFLMEKIINNSGIPN